MEKITKQQVEQAIQEIKSGKIKKSEIEAKISNSEQVVEAYGRDHLGEFTDGRLSMDAGIIAIKAGTAKPVKQGKPLSTAARSELAAALPAAYVKVTPDFLVLYTAQDKVVRQILKSRGIDVVREDSFSVI